MDWSRIEKRIDAWDGVAPTRLFKIDVWLGIWVALAHGGFLLLPGSSQVPALVDVFRSVTFATIPLALLLVASGFAALRRSSIRARVLSIHAVVLCAAAIAGFAWAASLVVFGLPESVRSGGVGFAWAPGILTFVVSYPVYLLRRSFFGQRIASRTPCRYVHLIVACVALPVDIAVLVRFIVHFANVLSVHHYH